MKVIPILLTTCIKPSAPFTVLNDIDKRIDSTLNGVRELSRVTNRKVKVVICDGSGFDFADYQDEINALFNEVEILSFLNSEKEVALKGKGFGEGEIVEYALKNSAILSGYQHFAKLTGKLWVENLMEIINSYNNFAAFLPTLARYDNPICIDTRFYITSKKFYFENLINVHNRVEDLNRIHLEDVFFSTFKNNNFKVDEIVMNKYPEIFGCSGSTGKLYKPKRVELLKKSIKLYIYRITHKGRVI